MPSAPQEQQCTYQTYHLAEGIPTWPYGNALSTLTACKGPGHALERAMWWFIIPICSTGIPDPVDVLWMEAGIDHRILYCSLCQIPTWWLPVELKEWETVTCDDCGVHPAARVVPIQAVGGGSVGRWYTVVGVGGGRSIGQSTKVDVNVR